jgi:hypothetical protein
MYSQDKELFKLFTQCLQQARESATEPIEWPGLKAGT